MREILTTRFNEIIARHLERLMGSAQAEGGLSLNMVTLGCLILLATKEIEIENFPDDAIDRYTFQTLQEEAALLGIECGKPLEMHLNDMIEKGYLKVDSEDKLIACKPAIAVTDTFDRIFPKMRSFNLLAYIGQTIEETVTGRTDIESATSRLDQTLRHHGVSLSTPIRASASARQQTDDRHGVRETIYENRRSREEILAELYGRGKSSENSARSASRPNRVIGGGTVLKSITVDGIIRKKELLKTEEAATAETDAKEEFPESPGPASPQSAPLSEQPLENEEVDIEIIDGPSPQPDGSDGASAIIEHKALSLPQASCHDEEESKEAVRDEGEEAIADKTLGDNAIAERIASFEKDISLTCPMCKATVLREQSTEAGKKYYACPSRNCNFISWGKPHHVECQRCRNPFLIETSDASGNTILKCPRATCQHRQGLSPKVVKVVRKRVVRRRV